MFRCGDQVLYGIHGVCTIIALETRRIDKKLIEYYVLEPVDQTAARFYIPTRNQAAVSKLRPMITQAELDALLRSDEACADAWIADENQRKQHYRDLITSGDTAALIRMVHTLHKHKREQETAGRKFHLCDENFLRDAERLLNTEFSLVLNIPQDEVVDYVQKAMIPE